MRALLVIASCALLTLAAMVALGDGTPLVQVQRTSTGATAVETTIPAVAGEPGASAPQSGDAMRPTRAPATRITAPASTGKAASTAPVPVPVPARADATAGVALPPSAPPSLLLPVQGVRADQLHDTFTDARNEGRSHDAIDIMAPAGTPVLAVADGTVEKLFDSQRGGLTVYQFEPGGRFAYYYAHLQRYAEGLAEGQAVERGQVIGYVGSTGNASPDAPHLHFAIFVLGPERRWWEGTAINPYPVLRGVAPLP